MKERPILFSAPMVRAILSGNKSQTRRVVKPQPVDPGNGQYLDAYCSQPKTPTNPRGMSEQWNWWLPDNRLGDSIGKCPYGQPGEKLWLRETLYRDNLGVWRYRSDDTSVRGDARGRSNAATCASIHMPRWASRITLEITNVRAERLQDISDGDCMAEGSAVGIMHARAWYRSLWNDINGAGAWDANPWVWALTFRRVTT